MTLVEVAGECYITLVEPTVHWFVKRETLSASNTSSAMRFCLPQCIFYDQESHATYFQFLLTHSCLIILICYEKYVLFYFILFYILSLFFFVFERGGAFSELLP